MKGFSSLWGALVSAVLFDGFFAIQGSRRGALQERQ